MEWEETLNNEDLGIVLTRILEYSFKILQCEQCTARLEEIELLILIQHIEHWVEDQIYL